jgi:hypothetical protein
MKLASLIGLFSAAAILLSLPIIASEQPRNVGKDGVPEVNVVLRISRKLVNELTTKKYQRTNPVYLCVLNSEIKGLAFTDATSAVQFETKAGDTDFVVELRGTTVSQTMAGRPLIQVFGSGHMQFILRKRVTFDGIKFSSQPTSFDGVFRTSVDAIATPPGLIGLLIEVLATPKIRRSQPAVASAGYEDNKARLIALFDEEIKQVIDDLNEVSPLEETVEKLFPQTKDWIYSPTITPTHIIVGVGPRNYRLPEIPISSKTDAPVEVWIRSKPETQGMIAVLKLWKDANKQLAESLPAEVAKKLKLEQGIRTQTVKDWFVIRLGGDFADPKEEPSPAPSMIVFGSSGPGNAKNLASGPGGPLFAQDRCTASGAIGDAIKWRPIPKTSSAAAQGLPADDPDPTRIFVIWRPVTTHQGTMAQVQRRDRQ